MVFPCEMYMVIQWMVFNAIMQTFKLFCDRKVLTWHLSCAALNARSWSPVGLSTKISHQHACQCNPLKVDLNAYHCVCIFVIFKQVIIMYSKWVILCLKKSAGNLCLFIHRSIFRPKCIIYLINTRVSLSSFSTCSISKYKYFP